MITDSCKQWVTVEGVKVRPCLPLSLPRAGLTAPCLLYLRQDVEILVPEIYWWKHAKACHQSGRMPGDLDIVRIPFAIPCSLPPFSLFPSACGPCPPGLRIRTDHLELASFFRHVPLRRFLFYSLSSSRDASGPLPKVDALPSA